MTLVPVGAMHLGEDERCELYAGELRRVAPSWAAMKVRLQARYLGYEIGPAVGEEEARAPALARYRQRVSELVLGRLAPSLGVRLHDERAAPVLGYIAQLVPAPRAMGALAAAVVEWLWHVPHRSLPRDALPPLRLLGAPLPRDLAGGLREIYGAAARRLEAKVATAHRALSAARDEFGSLASLADGWGGAEAPMWRSAALVDGLRAALDAPQPDGRAGGTKAETKKLWAAAGKAARRGRIGPVHPAQEEAAAALLPRLRRWLAILEVPLPSLHSEAARALRALVGVAPAIWVAVLKTWTDGWATSHRRGKSVVSCIFCGRSGGDRVVSSAAKGSGGGLGDSGPCHGDGGHWIAAVAQGGEQPGGGCGAAGAFALVPHSSG